MIMWKHRYIICYFSYFQNIVSALNSNSESPTRIWIVSTLYSFCMHTYQSNSIHWIFKWHDLQVSFTFISKTCFGKEIFSDHKTVYFFKRSFNLGLKNYYILQQTLLYMQVRLFIFYSTTMLKHFFKSLENGNSICCFI